MSYVAAYAMLGGTAAVLLAVVYASAVSVSHNWQQVKTARSVAPLHGLDLSAASVGPVPTPRRWPGVDTIDDAPHAAAYASLAEERMVTWAAFGELLMIVGGAALGVVVPDALRGGWHIASFSGALLVAVAGLLLRAWATRFWDPVAARYRARYRALTAQPLPEPEPARHAGVLGRLLRRN